LALLEGEPEEEGEELRIQLAMLRLDAADGLLVCRGAFVARREAGHDFLVDPGGGDIAHGGAARVRAVLRPRAGVEEREHEDKDAARAPRTLHAGHSP